jgi:hypothetical protein
MTNQDLTAGEIAVRIQQPGEDLRAISERLRTWTKEGLIKPLGKRSPGTGRHHRYPERALIDAAILSQLSQQYGLWGKKAPLFTNALLDKAVDELPKMSTHREKRRIAYLVFGTIGGKFLGNVQIVNYPKARTDPADLRLMIPPTMDDAILINLNRLFERLGIPLEEVKGGTDG